MTDLHAHLTRLAHPIVGIAAAGEIANSILNDPAIAVVELPEAQTMHLHAHNPDCDCKAFLFDHDTYRITASDDGIVEIDQWVRYFNLREGDDPVPLAAALLAAARKAEEAS